MSGVIDDSEDNIIVWNSSAVSTKKLTEEKNNLPCDEDINDNIIGDAEEEDSVVFDENTAENMNINEDSEDSVYEKKYYKISEVESIIGETQSTIRFWEDSFAELGKNFCSQRSRGGTRKFTKENIENLKLLQLLLRERRLTIEGAISEIKSERKRNVKERALILLKETRDELNNLIDAYNYVLHKKC